MIKRAIVLSILASILIPTIVFPITQYLAKITFNEQSDLDKWSKMILNGQVDYEVIRSRNSGFLHALSEKTCSAIYYRLNYKLADYPVITWRWRVEKFPDKAKAVTPKERDDYSARVYVIFPFFSFSTSKFIEYVWDKDIPAGTVLDSPDGNNIKLFVIRTGQPSGGSGAWCNEQRNVYDDYIKAFGVKPNRNVGAVAIMCDADGTKSVAESNFDGIYIEKLLGEKKEVG